MSLMKMKCNKQSEMQLQINQQKLFRVVASYLSNDDCRTKSSMEIKNSFTVKIRLYVVHSCFIKCTVLSFFPDISTPKHMEKMFVLKLLAEHRHLDGRICKEIDTMCNTN